MPDKLGEKLAVTEGLLYRRGNFNGTFDQLIIDALLAVQGADIAFSPGFRWGTTLLPGDTITMEHLMDQTAITYATATVNHLTGEQIKVILEDIADNLYHTDPYYQQGGDMVRVGGLQYTLDIAQTHGQRIQNATVKGKPLDAAQEIQGRRLGQRPADRARQTRLGCGRRLSARGENRPRRPTLYSPAQRCLRQPRIRCLKPAAATPASRRAVSAIDPAYLQTKATTMDIARYPRRTCRVNSENIYP